MALSLFEIIWFNSSEKLFKLVIKRAVHRQKKKQPQMKWNGDGEKEELLCVVTVPSVEF